MVNLVRQSGGDVLVVDGGDASVLNTTVDPPELCSSLASVANEAVHTEVLSTRW